MTTPELDDTASSISAALDSVDEILKSILRAFTPDTRQKTTCTLVQRTVEVKVQVARLVNASRTVAGPEWPRHIVALAEALHGICLFAETEKKPSSSLYDLFARTSSRRRVALEHLTRLNDVLVRAEQYDKKLKADDLIAAAAQEAHTRNEAHTPSQRIPSPMTEEFRSHFTSSGEMFSKAHDLSFDRCTFYAIQQTPAQEYILGIVPGIRVVAFEDVSLEREMHWNPIYRLHSAHVSGQARAVKVYQGPQAREHAQEAARFNQRVLHPSLLHMRAASPLNSGVPFLVFDGGFEGSLEASLAKVLRKDLRRSIILGLQTVVGVSSGLDYLQDVEYPFGSARLEHFNLLLNLEGRVIISFDPDIIFDSSNESDLDHEDGSLCNEAVQATVIFHELCQQTFNAACKAHYEGQHIERADFDNLNDSDILISDGAFIEEAPSDLEEKDAISAELPPQNPSKKIAVSKTKDVRRRELVWIPEDQPNFTLKHISREFGEFLEDLPAHSNDLLSRRRGRYTAKTAHRCTGYTRTEITLTPNITRSAIVTHSAPLPREICPVCNQVVKDAQIFNCKCRKDDGYLPTIQCSMCDEWHHRGCISDLDPAASSFTCYKCRPAPRRVERDDFLTSFSNDTPSPSYSTSTLPSSTGPITPPALGARSPYYNTPLPGIATSTLPSSTGPITPPALGARSPYYNTPLPGIATSTLPSSTGPITPPALGARSPYYNTPLPGIATSTLPSSTGPITPPALGPRYNTPLPGIEIQLHSWLHVDARQVEFDMSLPVSSIQVPSHDFREVLARATYPPIPFMTVTCARLPWTITIVPRSQISSFVTIGDVFETLYIALRKPVTAAEYALLPRAVAQEMVNRAFRMRCSRDGGSELKKGVKRIDFLGRQTRFCGLEPVKHGLGGWILKVL